MRKKALKNTTIAVIVVVLLLVFCWALLRALSAADALNSHVHSRLSFSAEDAVGEDATTAPLRAG